MHNSLSSLTDLAQWCEQQAPEAGVAALATGLKTLMPDLEFVHVLTRGGWHRLGGVVDENYQRIADNIAEWAERESGGDVDTLVADFMDRGWFATHLAGKTHYLTAPTGPEPESFLQIELEEVQEVLDRPLVERDWYPDSLEEFLDPLDYPRLEPESIGRPCFRFRRMTPITGLLQELPPTKREGINLRRFFSDWATSSAADGEHFCRYWVLALREYMNSDGEARMVAKPVTTNSGKLPELPTADALRGAELANAVHNYDRKFGFPFAWYFIMLSGKTPNYALAEAVLRDQQGAYDYIPPRDLKVLRAWEERPYAV